jgi:hypothetical protein
MQWSLENIYKKQVRGNIPTRKHLRVLGEGGFNPVEMEAGSYQPDQESVEEDPPFIDPKTGKWVRRDAKGRLVAADVPVGNVDEICRFDQCKIDVQHAMQDAYDEGDTELVNRIWRAAINADTPELINVLLKTKHWDDHTKRYGEELANRILPHITFDKKNIKAVKDFLEDSSKHLQFPKKTQGNIGKEIINGLKAKGVDLDPRLITDLMMHKTQDARTRGIGMGELAMSIFFDNIAAAEGAGDLHVLDGEGKIEGAQLTGPDGTGEFELKGHGAILGDDPAKKKPQSRFLAPLNIHTGVIGETKAGSPVTGIIVGEEQFKKGEFAEAIVSAYDQAEDKDLFKQRLWKMLADKNGPDMTGGGNPDKVEQVYNKMFTGEGLTPESVSTTIGLMNFVRYATKEGFDHFMLHDYGQVSPSSYSSTGEQSPGTPFNSGAYVYVSGDALSMAEKLSNIKNVGFERIAINNVRPRIGLPEMAVKVPRRKRTARQYGVGVTPYKYTD